MFFGTDSIFGASTLLIPGFVVSFLHPEAVFVTPKRNREGTQWISLLKDVLKNST